MSIQARPKDYAAAIYDLAFDTWTRQLGNVQKALKTDATLRAALEDPSASTQDKLKGLGQAMPEGLDPTVRKFLGTLLEAGQLNQLDAILVEFEQPVGFFDFVRKKVRILSLSTMLFSSLR